MQSIPTIWSYLWG